MKITGVETLTLSRVHEPERQWFTALFCANDSTAVGALKALREAGRSVPSDVSLVAYDDYMDIAA